MSPMSPATTIIAGCGGVFTAFRPGWIGATLSETITPPGSRVQGLDGARIAGVSYSLEHMSARKVVASPCRVIDLGGAVVYSTAEKAKCT